MPQFIFRIICLISTLVFLCGILEAAPVGSRAGTQELSSADNFYERPTLGFVREGATSHVDAEDKERYYISEEDGSLLARSWVDDGSDVVVLERRGFLDFFRNIGRKIKEGFQKIGDGIKHVANKIKEGFQTAGRKIKEGFQTAGRKIKEGFQTAGRKIKEGFQTAGRKMKEGFEKAGHWIKETGAKIAKFGLKVVATVGAVAAHVVRFIPVVGQAASMALKGASFGLNKASEAIHANLGDKLEKGMHVMDIIQDPIGALVKKAAHAAMPAMAHVFHAHAAAHGAPHSAPHQAPPPPYHEAVHVQSPHKPPPYHVAVHSPAPHNAPPPPYHAAGHAAAPPQHHAPPPVHHH